MLGDNNNYHFHSTNNRFWVSNSTHNHIKFDSYLAVNGTQIDGLSSNVPTEMSVISLRTSGNVEASNFSNDRNIDGRYWDGDLAELLIYNTPLSDEEIEQVEVMLGMKWAPYKQPLDSQESLDTSAVGDWKVTYQATDGTGVNSSISRNIES